MKQLLIALMRRKPGTDTNFRRRLPEIGCLSQGLPKAGNHPGLLHLA
jgi:hypothetical protein